MRRALIASLLFASTAGAAQTFGTALPCDGLSERDIRQARPHRVVAFFCCRAVTYDGADLVWVRTCFAVRRHGRVSCVTTDVLDYPGQELRRVIFDGCGLDR